MLSLHPPPSLAQAAAVGTAPGAGAAAGVAAPTGVGAATAPRAGATTATRVGGTSAEAGATTTEAGAATGLSRLLILADSRTPTGAHAHSGGVEQAIARGMVRDTPSLLWFLRRRLATAGLLAAAAAAAASRRCDDPAALAELDDAVEVRTPSPAMRQASRNQGRGLLRLARRLPVQLPPIGGKPHHPVILGSLAGALGVPDRQAAAVAAQLTASGIAGAAQRLLALDPLEVAAGLVDIAEAVDGTAAAGAAAGQLPDLNDPLADLLAEEHYARKDRFFVS